MSLINRKSSGFGFKKPNLGGDQNSLNSTLLQQPGETNYAYIHRLMDGIVSGEDKQRKYEFCFGWFSFSTYDVINNHQLTDSEFEKQKTDYLERAREFFPTIPEQDHQEIINLIKNIPYEKTLEYLSDNLCRFFKLITGEDFIV